MQDTRTPSQPTLTKNSPAKSNSKSKGHELNSTYKISREISMPIVTKSTEELEPFVVDGAGKK